jgi:hypothetical protein
MDHIRNIQELICENRESIPTGVVHDVMRECQNAYFALPKLWKIYYVEFTAAGKNKIHEDPKARIIEEDFERYPNTSSRIYWADVISSGKIPPEDKHKDIRPVDKIVHFDDGRVCIITKVEPFLKRARTQIDGDD